jgi:hypothetical protein
VSHKKANQERPKKGPRLAVVHSAASRSPRPDGDDEGLSADLVSLMALLRAAQQFDAPLGSAASRTAPAAEVSDFSDDFVSLLDLLRTADQGDSATNNSRSRPAPGTEKRRGGRPITGIDG